ncbi:MAG: type I-E CRISPR-associated protein Cas7/Cse4/CasC [Desulfovibrio sp.]|nr:type I-E CRISPR-associated protein Cas7/Cse4/CasC [Desulfovibrio sp.]
MTVLNGYRIEFHILQSFPVTCLNRDDVGAPKSAIIGGVPRARVSSQCWKRHVRLKLHEFGVKTALRTKQIADVIVNACIAKGADKDKAREFSEAVATILAEDTLLFFSESEAMAFAEAAIAHNFNVEAAIGKKGKGLTSEFKKLHKLYFNPAVDGLDIALFGRMVAQAPELNIEAATCFAHAISTHRSSAEIDFFTAVDDNPMGISLQGSAHMGALEFNSATYYRYVSLDLGQLAETLGYVGLADAVSSFTKALYLAVPSARQTTQTGLHLWDYARVFVRKGQGMQVSFDKPVREKGGFLAPSIEALEQALTRQEKQAGSLFGKQADYTFGKADAEISIDELAEELASFVRPFEVQA